MLLSGAWPKSKAALFEFSEVRQGFTIINNHMVPGNGLLFCTGEGQCLLALCSSAAGIQRAKASHKQGGFLDVAPTSACPVAKARALRDGATSLVLLAQMPVQERPTWRQSASWGDSPVSLQTESTLGLWEEQEGYV